MVRYKRILVKTSGEALMGEKQYGIDPNVLYSLASQLKEVYELGVEIALVVGGGNIFRGAQDTQGMDRSSADYIGMLATVMNGMALQNVLEKLGVATRLQSAIQIHSIAEPFIKRRAIRHLEKKRLVIFVGGIGSPYFTTDSTGAVRAMEIGVEILFKATKVDGIYDSDPLKNPSAKKYHRLSYEEFLSKNLRVMDATAVTLCREQRLPIMVFNLLVEGNLKRAVLGENVGTLVLEKY